MNRSRMLSILARTGQGILSRRHVDYLIFYVTRLCNLQCRHCFNKDERAAALPTNELTLREIELIAKSLRPLLHLVVSGGEPFLRQELAQIIQAFITHSKVRFIAVPTNGVLTELILQTVTQLVKQFPSVHFNINVSLDGLEATHDELRCAAGTFQKAVATARLLGELRKRHANLGVNILSVVTPDNADQLGALREYVQTTINPDFHDVGLDRTTFWRSEYSDWASSMLPSVETAATTPAPSMIGRIHHRLNTLMFAIIKATLKHKRMVFPCLAGRKMAVITPDGTVYPCETLWFEQDRFQALRDYRIGSMRVCNYSWSGVMRTDQYRAVTSLIKKRFCYCTWECAIFNSLQYSPCYTLRLALGDRTSLI